MSVINRCHDRSKVDAVGKNAIPANRKLKKTDGHCCPEHQGILCDWREAYYYHTSHRTVGMMGKQDLAGLVEVPFLMPQSRSCR